jgi:hypothetical protein
MDYTTITYKYHGEPPMTIPVNYNKWQREPNCVDIILMRAMALDCPLTISISIRTNGDIELMSTEWKGEANTYWHLYDAPEDFEAGISKRMYKKITQAQAETIALIFAGDASSRNRTPEVLPNELLRALGATPQVLLEPYGNVVEVLQGMGHGVPAMTAPCDEHERIIANGNRQEPDDEIAKQEAYLEQACEEGQMPGAMPADI